jgi:hypothetical protein
MQRPLLLLDIDGVISLFGFDPERPPPGRFLLVDGIVHYLSATVAELVIGLGELFETVWCSGWEEKADEHLPHALGLPSGLPHLSFARELREDPRHWKLAAIDAFAGGRRPLAWVDDGFDDSCHRWARERASPTLLVATDPAAGLTASHAERLRGWAGALPA